MRFGVRGRSPGQLQRPTGVTVDMNGDIVVADYDNRWVSIFSSDGKFKVRSQLLNCSKERKRRNLRRIISSKRPAPEISFLSLLKSSSSTSNDRIRSALAGSWVQRAWLWIRMDTSSLWTTRPAVSSSFSPMGSWWLSLEAGGRLTDSLQVRRRL